MSNKKLLVTGFLTLGAAPAFAGVCGLSIVASSLSLDWDLSWGVHAISITVSKTNPAACTFGLGFSKGGSASYTRRATSGGNNLVYQVYQDNGGSKVLKDAPDIATANDVIMVTMAAGANPQTLLYYFDVPFVSATTPAMVPAGTYTDSFDIHAYEGAVPASFAAPPDASAAVGVTINVPKMVEVSLVDTGGVFQDSATTKSIELGNLSTGQSSRFDLRIRTNSGYVVTATSANTGKMKHATKNLFIPYTFSVNNVAADMTGVVPVLNGSGSSPLTGLGYPCKIVIGAVGPTAVAGTYSDTILITTTAE